MDTTQALVPPHRRGCTPGPLCASSQLICMQAHAQRPIEPLHSYRSLINEQLFHWQGEDGTSHTQREFSLEALQYSLYAPLGGWEQGQNAPGRGRLSFPWRYRQPAGRGRGYERGNHHANTLTRDPFGVATRSRRGHAHQASIHRKRRHFHRALPTRHMPPLDEATWEIGLVPYHPRQHRARRGRERHDQAYEEEYTP